MEKAKSKNPTSWLLEDLNELSKTVLSEIQLEGSDNYESGSDLGTPLHTPGQQLGLQKSGHQMVNVETSLSSGGGSSVLSVKEGTESSSSSSSSSESESFDPSLDNCHGPRMDTDRKGLIEEITKLKVEFPSLEELHQMVEEDNTDNMSWARDKRNYEELLRRFNETLEKLKVSNLKLQLSEKEVIYLKSELEKSQSFNKSLDDQLDLLQKDFQKREADLEMEKGLVLELQKQTASLETHVPDCSYKIAELVEELEVTRASLKKSDEEITTLKYEVNNAIGNKELQDQLRMARENITMLEAQLDSERELITELNERIAWYKSNESDHDLEVKKFKAALHDVQEQFSLEKEQLQSAILSLSEEKVLLDSMLKEWELRSESYDHKIRQCGAEILEIKKVNVSQQMVLQGEINRLKEELCERSNHVEALNKEFDRHKHKYDMLMAEKDEVNAKAHKLMAEVSSRDTQIMDMERQLCQLRMEQRELISGSETTRDLVRELKQKVEELENEVSRLNSMISDRAEEKREAIRQLCFSLEHYRSGYQELLQAFVGHKRHAVVAS
ncbi:Protein NETWORKED 4A like [Quillaja saponaria]|uniref:Protein NETWORKED 4A like n=1 Tax=Quillaja saponaria TaxID=32244 RepID=A0AAD7LKA0_QUISA|nr:Protein NETWORKED 4A like [Quillaja saponaria]